MQYYLVIIEDDGFGRKSYNLFSSVEKVNEFYINFQKVVKTLFKKTN